MKTLIVCDSVHMGNTQKIAEVFAKVLGATVIPSSEVEVSRLSEYDLVGFGSGIYMGKHNKALLGLVDRLPFGSGRKVFIFSTSWSGLVKIEKNHKELADKFLSKDFKIVGNFSCLGATTFGPLKWFGGINKKHPDAEELELARMFAEGMRSGR